MVDKTKHRELKIAQQETHYTKNRDEARYPRRESTCYSNSNVQRIVAKLYE